MLRILTLTMNPALDIATDVERVEPEYKLRCEAATLDPGGGGINVARVIHRLGGEALPIVALGGPIGQVLRSLLHANGIAAETVDIAGDTRLDFTVDERATRQQYRFVLQGPRLEASEWRRCLEALQRHLEVDALVVASGSLPPGVPEDFYAMLARIVRAAGARCVLDTSGVPLRAALDEGVYLVKPNRRELEQLVGHELREPAAQEAAIRALIARGASEIVALTLGAQGAVMGSGRTMMRAAPPPVAARSAVGAGDSFVGALVLALAQHAALEQVFRRAMAAGAAALLTPATELCRREDVERLEREVDIIAG